MSVERTMCCHHCRRHIVFASATTYDISVTILLDQQSTVNTHDHIKGPHHFVRLLKQCEFMFTN